MKTDFSEIKFDADKHRYYLNGTELTGVLVHLQIGHQVYKALDLRSRLLDWLRS